MYRAVGKPPGVGLGSFGPGTAGAGPGCSLGYERGGMEPESKDCPTGGCDSEFGDARDCCGVSHWRDSVYHRIKGGQAYQYFQEAAIRRALYDLLDVPTPTGFPSRLDEYAYDACGDEEGPAFTQSLEALRARLKRAGFNLFSILPHSRWFVDATGTKSPKAIDVVHLAPCSDSQEDGWYSKRRVYPYLNDDFVRVKVKGNDGKYRWVVKPRGTTTENKKYPWDTGEREGGEPVCARQDGGWTAHPAMSTIPGGSNLFGPENSELKKGFKNPCIGGAPTVNKEMAIFNVTGGKPAKFWDWWEDFGKPLIRFSPISSREHHYGGHRDASATPRWKAWNPEQTEKRFTGTVGPAEVAHLMLTCGPSSRYGACSGCEAPADRWAAQHGGDPGNRVTMRDMGKDISMRWWSRFLDVFAPMPDVGGGAPKIDTSKLKAGLKLFTAPKKGATGISIHGQIAPGALKAASMAVSRRPAPVLVAHDEGSVDAPPLPPAPAPKSNVPYILGGITAVGLVSVGVWYWRKDV